MSRRNASRRRGVTRRSVGRWLLVALATWPALAISEAPARLEPYVARYQVSYRGMTGGEIESSLTRGDSDGVWVYNTRAFPNFLGQFAVSSAANEHGTMQIDGESVRPLSLTYDDGSTHQDKDIRVAFDWNAQRVSGEAKGKPFDYAVTPGTQDTASVQAAMLVELLAGHRPEGFRLVSGGELRDYRYWCEGTATIVTPAGRFETVIWANQGTGSSRISRVWHAPSLGYVPVQAIQYRKGKAELQMRLLRIERP